MLVLSPQTVPLPLEHRPALAIAAVSQVTAGNRSFQLPDLWSLLVFHYQMEAAFDHEWLHVPAGTLALLPPGAHKCYRQRGTDLRHHVCHFRLASGGRCATVPRLIDLGVRYGPLRDSLDDAVGWFAQDPLRAEIRLWDVLHQIADLAPAQDRRHPALQAALRVIERQLDRPLSIAQVAAEVGLSHGHLCTLFRRDQNCTPLAWLQGRRLARARHLLEHSTLPVKVIAKEVGYPDLQHFNKALRRWFGCGPREVRRRASLES